MEREENATKEKFDAQLIDTLHAQMKSLQTDKEKLKKSLMAARNEFTGKQKFLALIRCS